MILPPERLQIPFIVSSFGFIFTLIGLLAWGCSAAGGAGPLWNVEASPIHGDVSWAMLFGIAGVLGKLHLTSPALLTKVPRLKTDFQAPGEEAPWVKVTGRVMQRSLTIL